MKYVIAVVLALVFASYAQAQLLPQSTVVFVGPETTVQGYQHNTRGTDGYMAAGLDFEDQQPMYAAIDTTFASYWLWEYGTTDPRSVIVRDFIQPDHLPVLPGQGIAATWFSFPSLTIGLDLTDGNTHSVSLYAVDYDGQGRDETVLVYDTVTGILLDMERIPYPFKNGLYLVWKIKGNVTFDVICNQGPNAVVSAFFFDPPAQ
jgi:hypothetical protein